MPEVAAAQASPLAVGIATLVMVALNAYVVLGGADFGAGVDVETAISGARNRRTDDVDDPDAQRPLGLCVLESA